MLLMFSSALAAVVQKSVRKESTAETLDKLGNWPSYFRKTANIWNRHSSFLTSSILRNEFSDEVAHAVCKKAICQWTAWRDAMHFRGLMVAQEFTYHAVERHYMSYNSCKLHVFMYVFILVFFTVWLKAFRSTEATLLRKRRNCFLLYLPRPPNDFCARS